MSTKKIREALAAMKACIKSSETWTQEMEEKAMAPAVAEVEAIKKAAKTLTKHHVADVMVDGVAHSEEVVSAMTTPESQWFHPEVTAVGEAVRVLESIAKEAP